MLPIQGSGRIAFTQSAKNGITPRPGVLKAEGREIGGHRPLARSAAKEGGDTEPEGAALALEREVRR